MKLSTQRPDGESPLCPDEELDDLIRAAYEKSRDPSAGGGVRGTEAQEATGGVILRVRTGDASSSGTDRYELREEIARGGVGIVLSAWDRVLDREIALKVLLNRHRANRPLLQQFRTEARIAGVLRLPGVPQVVDVGVLDDGRPYYAMDRIRGCPLSRLLSSRPGGRGEQRRLVEVVTRAAETIARAHERGVVHGDLSPSNVMISSFGDVYVIDWGLACVSERFRQSIEALGDSTSSGLPSPESPVSSSSIRQLANRGSSIARVIAGTPAYMSPEQAAGHRDSIDERTDVFGLGATLCDVLTGRPPYSEPDVQAAQLSAQAARLGPALEQLERSSVDDRMLEMTRRCLEPDPAARFQAVQELVDRLEEWLTTRSRER